MRKARLIEPEKKKIIPPSGLVIPDHANLSPKQLAYALPGAFLAYATRGHWSYSPHLELMEDAFLDIAYGKIDRLIVIAPPRSGKSSFFSEGGTAWFAGRFPDKRIILTSYEATFAASWGRKSRNHLEAFGPEIFGIQVNPDSAAVNHWNILNRRGGMNTAGAGGPIVGYGADLFIIDDPIKNDKQAFNRQLLQDVINWYKAVVYTRLSPTGAIIIVMARWAEDDLIGYVLSMQEKTGEKWRVIHLPALIENEDDARCDSLKRKLGESLWPSGGWTAERYLRTKAVQEADYWWDTQYQGRPTSLKGDIVSIDWFRAIEHEFTQEEADGIIISWDTAQKADEVHDYTVAGTWHTKGEINQLIDVVRERVTHPRLLELASDIQRIRKPTLHLVEDKGSGTSLIQHMEEKGWPVLAIQPEGDKVMRMVNEGNTIKAGGVYLSGSAPWRADFLKEIRAFPRSDYKDQADMLSQFLKWRRLGGSGIDLF
jgi:predicted phage terminase large subunit-like protein